MNALRPDGWFADDLDRLPEAPRHTEVVDGSLVFPASPSGPGTAASSPP